MASLLILLGALVVSGYRALSRSYRESSDWQAMVTPLASIMGSGFPVCTALCLAVFLLGLPAE